MRFLALLFLVSTVLGNRHGFYPRNNTAIVTSTSSSSTTSSSSSSTSSTTISTASPVAGPLQTAGPTSSIISTSTNSSTTASPTTSYDPAAVSSFLACIAAHTGLCTRGTVTVDPLSVSTFAYESNPYFTHAAYDWLETSLDSLGSSCSSVWDDEMSTWWATATATSPLFQYTASQPCCSTCTVFGGEIKVCKSSSWYTMELPHPQNYELLLLLRCHHISTRSWSILQLVLIEILDHWPTPNPTPKNSVLVDTANNFTLYGPQMCPILLLISNQSFPLDICCVSKSLCYELVLYFGEFRGYNYRIRRV